MSAAEGKKSPQPDKDEAATERPVPSQAEGDRETVDKDLEEKKKATNPLYKP